jgi:hypothetical protein
LLNAAEDAFAESHLVELLQHGLVETLADPVIRYVIPAARTVDSDVNWRGSMGRDSHSSPEMEGVQHGANRRAITLQSGT